MLFQSFLLGIAFAAPLGPTNIEMVRRGVQQGFRSAFAFNIGGVTGDAVHLLLIFLGLAWFAEEYWFQVGLGFFGAVVLFVLGAMALYEAFAIDVELDTQVKSTKSNVMAGILITFSNPTALPSWLAMYGVLSTQDIPTAEIPLHFFFIVLGAFFIGTVYCGMCHIAQKRLSVGLMRLISFVSGVMLLGFSGLFGYQLFQALFY